MFIKDFFSENVEYCIYVFKVCRNNGLIVSFEDIEDIARKYVDKLYDLAEDNNEIKESLEGEVLVEDEDLVFEVIKDFYDFVGKNEEDVSILDTEEETEESIIKEVFIAERLKFEKELNSHGGHNIIEFYDDIPVESIRRPMSLSLKKKRNDG